MCIPQNGIALRASYGKMNTCRFLASVAALLDGTVSHALYMGKIVGAVALLVLAINHHNHPAPR